MDRFHCTLTHPCMHFWECTSTHSPHLGLLPSTQSFFSEDHFGDLSKQVNEVDKAATKVNGEVDRQAYNVSGDPGH